MIPKKIYVLPGESDENSVYWGMGEAYQRVIDMLNEF